MPDQLFVFNHSCYSRDGSASVAWHPIQLRTGIVPEEVALFDESGTEIPCQVDSSRDTLIFSLPRKIDPASGSAPSAIFTIQRRSSTSQQTEKAHLKVLERDPNGRERVVQLSNERLVVSFNLLPSRGDPETYWYAGAATSVRLDGLEMLDAFAAAFKGWENHDPEKRCMQVDELRVEIPGSRAPIFQTVRLFDQPYQLVSKSSGSIWASITLASHAFDINTGDLESRGRYQFYRIISLLAGADYLLEELLVKRVPVQTFTAASAMHISFVPRYFAHMDLSFQPELNRFSDVPEWFAIGSRFSPYQGYGFATNARLDSVSYPHPESPDPTNRHKQFSWKTLPCQSATCLHLFMRSAGGRGRNHPEHFDARTGKCFHEVIDRPLIVRFE
jgi:hypothetical protein